MQPTPALRHQLLNDTCCETTVPCAKPQPRRQISAVLDRRSHGPPEIVNTDQGSQFSGEDFVEAVKACGARQSMDGKGCWRDNVFVERLWRSVKYEEVYLKAYDSVSTARQGLAAYLDFYNGRRPHQSHDGRTPDMIYFNTLQPQAEAA